LGTAIVNVSIYPLLMAAACMITAMTGLSYSIIILMIEMGNCPNLAIPMILAVLITKFLTENFGKPLAH
jgi:H+/Cl- antiporter ClcA